MLLLIHLTITIIFIYYFKKNYEQNPITYYILYSTFNRYIIIKQSGYDKKVGFSFFIIHVHHAMNKVNAIVVCSTVSIKKGLWKRGKTVAL